MKIGVDFDDVLIDCNTSLALFHNARYGTSYERKDIWTWQLERMWGCTRQEAVARVFAWYESLEHAETFPVLGAIEAVTELAQMHELYIITSRPIQVECCTRALYARHFEGIFAGMHFTSKLEPGHGSKAAVCKELGIPILIEDSIEHARAAAADGIRVLLFDTPWNQVALPENIVRVFGWSGVLDFLATTAPASA